MQYNFPGACARRLFRPLHPQHNGRDEDRVEDGFLLRSAGGVFDFGKGDMFSATLLFGFGIG